RAAHDEADRRIAAAREATACRPACTFCCHQQVSATGAEILVLAARLAALRPARRGQRRAAIRRALARTRGLDPVGRWRLREPCPLLGEDGLCTAYEDRPFGCRGYASRDVGACRQAFETAATSSPAEIPRPEGTRLGAVMLNAALDRALRAAGLPHQAYDLIHGLEIALGLGAGIATARYLAGEDVLAPARIGTPSLAAESARARNEPAAGGA
ncbi:MAG: YkgJ family cysteine cluster protein, partial [Alphaproteobacteria bacterium]